MRNRLALVVAALLLAPSSAIHADGLRVSNGDFNDLTGLTPFVGHGWYRGVPTGWTSSSNTASYSIQVRKGDGQGACNVSVLGRLEQHLGKLTTDADVVLTMDVTDEWKRGAELHAELLDRYGETLGKIVLNAGLVQRLVVGKVPAGTEIVVRFESVGGTAPTLDNIAVCTYPAGTQVATPQVEIRQFQPVAPIARAGRTTSVLAEVTNQANTDVELTATLAPPPGVRIVKTGFTNPVRINSAEGVSRLTWDVEAAESMTAELTLELKGPDGKLVVQQVLPMLFLPAVGITHPPYIPKPVRVPTQMLIGAHHCPLWEADKPEMWRNLLKHPERTPALGFYSQDNPEISDWETKWAVEHGISFFIYCWYRTSQGGAVKTRFSSAIHDAFFKSRFVNDMKFTIMWENQSRGRAGVASEHDLFTNLLPYWMENYFKHPSYLKVDNKPVLFIYRPEFLIDDLGSVANVAKAFDRMRQVCREAGFAGLHLLGEYRGTDRQRLERMKSLGLDYTFAYCWPVPNSPAPERAIEAQMESIRKTQELNILPQVVTVSQAWSGWRDEGSIWKIPPWQYEDLLRQAKEFTATLPKDRLGSRMLLLDNWNEWGEGHYIAPYREYGFGYLDAVRNVFSTAPVKHEDLIPEDIGRGPYDTEIRRYYKAAAERQQLAARRVVKANAPDGLAAWWTFDEPGDSPVAFDYSGHRNGGCLEQAQRRPGFAGSALFCNGSCVLVSGSQTLGELKTFTVECRVKTDVANQNGAWMINSMFGQNAVKGFRLGLQHGRPSFQVPETAWSHSLIGKEVLPLGKWVHLVATFDGVIMRIFMDGRECGSLSRPGPYHASNGRLVLGNYDLGHGAFFSGLIDDVRIYRRVLSAEEVRDNAQLTARIME